MAIVLNRVVLQQLLTGESGPVVRHIRALVEAVRAEAARRAPRDTGRLAASLTTSVNVYNNLVVGRVGSGLDYALYVHEGTGIYGPNHRPIRPVSAKVLRFRPGRSLGPAGRGRRGSSPERRGGWVFATEVAGSPAKPFLLEALEIVSPYPVRRRVV